MQGADRWCVVELYSGNLYGFINQRHPNIFNFKKNNNEKENINKNKNNTFFTKKWKWHMSQNIVHMHDMRAEC